MYNLYCQYNDHVFKIIMSIFDLYLISIDLHSTKILLVKLYKCITPGKVDETTQIDSQDNANN